MATVGTITARLGLDHSRFSGGLNKSRSNLASFATKATGLLAAAFAGKKIFDALSFGTKLAAENEKTTAAFETMLGSMDKAKNLMGDIEQFAASTPFQLDELNEGAKTLLAFGVGQDEVVKKMKMLGDIAAGTGKPIGDFVQIFGKVKATGKVSLESVNQLAERGVPIYRELAAQLGVSESQMVKMISSGKVGFSDLESAMTNTTTAGGIFAGGMEKQSRTASGLWSTLKDNVSFAIRDVGAAMIDGFDFKGLISGGIEFAQGLRESITGLKPLFQAVSGFVTSLIPDFAGSGSFMIATTKTIIEFLTTGFNIAEFAVKNFSDVAMLAFQSSLLQVVRFGSMVSHFFTGVMPALFDWFGENWFEIWMTVVDYSATALINIGKNVRNIMGEIWDFISSGGRDSLELTWTPLLDGFKNTIRELPDIPERAIGQLEAQLDADVKTLGGKVGENFQEFIEEKNKKFNELLTPPEVPTIEVPDTDSATKSSEAFDGKDSKGAAGLRVGEADTITALAKARIAAENRGGGDGETIQKQQLKEQKDTNKNLKDIADKTNGAGEITFEIVRF